ncbi:PA14 domain-containing protein [Flammeovirgaceae bacterium 311]|nr:PA14 domain-containing protein [Flammeovirgaceae bacterium 311]
MVTINFELTIKPFQPASAFFYIYSLLLSPFAMKAILMLLILMFGGGVSLYAQDCGPVPPNNDKVYPWCYKLNEGTNWNTSDYKAYIINGMPFRLLFPKGFDSTAVSTRKYPLTVMLHGLGMGGSDNNIQLKIGGKNHLEARNSGSYDGFVMVPQAVGELWNTPERATILKFVELALRDLPIDPFRVQLEGYSAGGASAWKLAYENPLVFSAAIVMSVADGNSARRYAEVLKYMPIWHAQGGRDSQPQPSAGERVASEFRKAGANYRYQYYHELGHGTWEAMYAEPDFFPFLMRSSMLSIHAEHFKYNFCEGETLKGVMGIRSGFEAYEWQKNGKPFGSNANEIQFNGAGDYTVRVKHKGLWSAWSKPLKVQQVGPTATPKIIATGPTALPTLDGRTTVTLRTTAAYQDYAWSDGSELDSLEVSKAGSYSVSVTEPFGCPSAASDPVKVTYNAVGVLSSPKRLTIGSVSETVLHLSWTDRSTTETGFELYRSRTPEGPWTLTAQLLANTTTFQDTNLNPYTRYFYAIRSVNEDGGSTYLNGSGKTHADALAPGIPARLSVAKTSRSTISLNWQAAADNATGPDLILYEIYANSNVLVGTTHKTVFTVKNLPEQKFYNFRVRAVDQMGNKSAFSNQVTAGTYINGLHYSYYEGTLTTVHDISLLKPVQSGKISYFDINLPGRADNHFAFSFEGYINITEAGTYTFYTTSDDGSTLSIDGFQVVNNDKVHNSQEKWGKVELTAGIHEIKVLYFEDTGSTEMLEVSWEGPDITKQPIPAEVFSESFTPPVPPAAPTAVTAAAVDAESILLNWQLEGTDSSAVEVYRSKLQEGPFVLVKTLSSGAAAYTDVQLEPSTTYYYQIRVTSATGESAFAGLLLDGRWVHATTKAGSPAAPTALMASRNGSSAAYLKWADNTGSENSFEVWRGTDGSSFTKIAATPANITSYSDHTVDSITSYHYQVRAVTAHSTSDWSNVAVLNSTNKPPVIAGIPAALVAPEGKTTEFQFDVLDAEGDSVSLISRYLPDFASIETTAAGKAKIIVRPTVKDIGFYSGIQLTAHDGVLEVDTSFTIRVINSEKTSIYVNVGNNSVAGAPWNNINVFGGQNNKVVVSNMLDEDGLETGYSLTLLDAWSASKPYGETSGNNSGIYPDVVTSSAYIIDPRKTARFKVSGLKADLRYNFVFFGSSIYKSHNGSTLYTVGDEQQSLEVQSNGDKTVQINGIKADANGEVIVSVAGAADATKGGFLNAFVIEQYPATGKLLRPGRLRAHAVSRTQLQLSWTDNADGETGYEVWRRTLPSEDFALIATAGVNATSFMDEAVSPDTGYEYKVRAAANGSFSAFSETKQAATLMYEVLINTNYSKNMGDPWVNLDQRPTTGYTWYNFENEDMQSTGINLKLDQSFDGNNAYGPDANGQGIYHDNVIKTFYYTEIGTVAKMQFYGLDDELTYNFRFFAASAFEGGESGVTAYRIENKKVTLDVEKNISNTAVIRDIQASDGSVVIEVEAGKFARYGYLNALEIEVRDAHKEINGATPAGLFDEESPKDPAAETDQSIILYPNPTQAALNIVFTAPKTGKYFIQILDLSGHFIHAQEVVAQEGKNTLTLDLGALLMSKGMYLLKIRSADFESRTSRFVKH